MECKDIFILIDYKGFFESKQKTRIYRGGMDIDKIISRFNDSGFNTETTQISQIDIDLIKKKNAIVIYTSSEDHQSHYKSFIEDIIFNLEQNQIRVLPPYKYLKAHNNKVAMELLRKRMDDNSINTIQSKAYGTLEELKKDSISFDYPVVIKTYAGAMSRGVAKASSSKELEKIASVFTRSTYFKHDIKEILRKLKYRGLYKKESFHRNKIIVQNLIPNLNNDWKVLVYGNKCFVLYRGARKNDFRASGSGDFEFRKEIPNGILDYAQIVKEVFNVSHISLDIGFDGKKFHLIEFQFLYFGTTTLEKAPFFFEKNNDKWVLKESNSILEEVYTDSVIRYIKDQVC